MSYIYHTQLAKMSFDKIFDLTAGVYFNFIINLVDPDSYTVAARGVADL